MKPGKEAFAILPTKVKRSTGGRTQQIRLRLSPTFPKILAMGDNKTEMEGKNHSHLTLLPAQLWGHGKQQRCTGESGAGK